MTYASSTSLSPGPLGEGFIEAHNECPLSEFDCEIVTSVTDLRMVCSNRMLYRLDDKANLISIEKLRMLIS